MCRIANMGANPEQAVKAAESAMTVMLMLTYLYACIIQRQRFVNMFQRFNASIVPNTGCAKEDEDTMKVIILS
jgi:thiazole synthase ThiGH ThiG subunit